MVLQDLGRRINAAVSDLTRSSNLDEKVESFCSEFRRDKANSLVQAFDGMIKEICNALMEADVNIKLVVGLRKSIKNTVNFKDLAPGVNKKKVIQKVRGRMDSGSTHELTFA
jgi:signal recognition particle subunit SRP54